MLSNLLLLESFKIVGYIYPVHQLLLSSRPSFRLVEILHLKGLRHLHLENVDLFVYSTEIPFPASLKSLDIVRCTVTSTLDISILSNLDQLESLRLVGNHGYVSPASVAAFELIVPPGSFSRLKSLKYFYLDENRVTSSIQDELSQLGLVWSPENQRFQSASSEET